MKFLKFVAYLFYDYYYSTGPRANIKYFATIGVMTLLSYLNLFAILILFNIVDDVMPSKGYSRGMGYVQTFFYMFPIWLMFRILIKEKELENSNYDVDKVSVGKVWLMLYYLTSVAVVILLILWRKGKI